MPQINTAEEASTAVSYTKFSPEGLRGQGSAFSAISHGIDMTRYMAEANETIIVCVQIESRSGVENVEAICAVPGIGKCYDPTI